MMSRDGAWPLKMIPRFCRAWPLPCHVHLRALHCALHSSGIYGRFKITLTRLKWHVSRDGPSRGLRALVFPWRWVPASTKTDIAMHSLSGPNGNLMAGEAHWRPLSGEGWVGACQTELGTSGIGLEILALAQLRLRPRTSECGVGGQGLGRTGA